MLNKDIKVQECNATEPNRRNKVDIIKNKKV